MGTCTGLVTQSADVALLPVYMRPQWFLDEELYLTNGILYLQVNAQLSFHGHRDSVKFFVAVPGSMKRVSQAATSTRSSSPGGFTARTSPEKTVSEAMLLVLSGGEGYVDFRLGDGEETALEEQGGDLISVTARGQSTNERSHIMVWQVSVT